MIIVIISPGSPQPAPWLHYSVHNTVFCEHHSPLGTPSDVVPHPASKQETASNRCSPAATVNPAIIFIADKLCSYISKPSNTSSSPCLLHTILQPRPQPKVFSIFINTQCNSLWPSLFFCNNASRHCICGVLSWLEITLLLTDHLSTQSSLMFWQINFGFLQLLQMCTLPLSCKICTSILLLQSYVYFLSRILLHNLVRNSTAIYPKHTPSPQLSPC